MATIIKIPGPALCGFADFFEEPRALVGSAVVVGGRGIKESRPAIVRKAAAAHKAAVAKLKGAVKKGFVKKGATKPNFDPRFKKVVIRGDEVDLIGADGEPVKKKLTAKQQAKAKKYNEKAAAAKAKGEAAKASLAHAAKRALALKQGIKHSAGKHVALKRTHVSMHGIFGVDPDDLPVDDLPTDDLAKDDPLTNETATTPATQAVPMDVAPRVVGDGVKYDGSKGWPRYAFGSKGFFDAYKGSEKDAPPKDKESWRYVSGYVWGFDQINWPESGDPVRWFSVNGVNDFGLGWAINWGDKGKQPGDPKDAAEVSGKSLLNTQLNGQSFTNGRAGPLIGNPKGDFAGLQWATEDKAWFWHPSRAPDWATVEIRNEAALRKREADAAAAAAKKADDDAKAKEKADREAEQAKQEFEQALAEKAAESEARVEETKRTSREASEALEQQRADREAEAEERRLAAEERRAQLEADREARKQELEEQRAQAEADRAAAAEARRTPSVPTYDDEPPASDEGDEPPPAPLPDESPEAAAEAEVDEIEEIEGVIGDDAAVDGAGNVIGIDRWGNAVN